MSVKSKNSYNRHSMMSGRKPKRSSRSYLIYATFGARSVGEDNLDVDVVVFLVYRLCVSPLVLPREEEPDVE